MESAEGKTDAWTRQKAQSACGCSSLPLAARIFSTLGKYGKQINADSHVSGGGGCTEFGRRIPYWK